MGVRHTCKQGLNATARFGRLAKCTFVRPSALDAATVAGFVEESLRQPHRICQTANWSPTFMPSRQKATNCGCCTTSVDNGRLHSELRTCPLCACAFYEPLPTRVIAVFGGNGEVGSF